MLEVNHIRQGRLGITRHMGLEATHIQVQWDRLHPMAMGYSIWREMSGSGAGIGMLRLIRVARIREGLRQATPV